MAQEVTVAEQLKQLYELQLIDAKIDEIEILKGELPIEVSDLEDDIAGLEIRIGKLRNTIKDLQANIAKQQANMKESESLIERYKQQLDNVKNNREFEALTKELDLARKEAETRVESMEALKTEHKKALDAEKKKRLAACEQARNDTIAEAEKQFNEANAHYLKLKKEYESCVAKVGKLEKELKAVRRELETTRTDVASREAEWTADLAQEKAGMCFFWGEMNMCIGQPAELTDCLCT